MSLILDALKKSEAERQRQSGPTLLEVRVMRPRRRYPAWVIAVGALLALNMLLLLAFVLHRPTNSADDGTRAGTAAVAPAAVAPSRPAAAAAPAAVPPMIQAAVGAGAAAPASIDGNIDGLVPVPRTFSQRPSAGDGQDSARNPADDEPAVPQGSASARLERETAAHYGSLPSFSEVSGDLPDLRLDLHVYAARASDRYALINMHRVHEGDALPEGPRVLAITREGVALDYRGQEFMLRPQ
jgi:general secretion pathway protein B